MHSGAERRATEVFYKLIFPSLGNSPPEGNFRGGQYYLAFRLMPQTWWDRDEPIDAAMPLILRPPRDEPQLLRNLIDRHCSWGRVTAIDVLSCTMHYDSCLACLTLKGYWTGGFVVWFCPLAPPPPPLEIAPTPLRPN